jgi:hypothetical protein
LGEPLADWQTPKQQIYSGIVGAVMVAVVAIILFLNALALSQVNLFHKVHILCIPFPTALKKFHGHKVQSPANYIFAKSPMNHLVSKFSFPFIQIVGGTQ